uniref:Coatomer subunit beta n=1 Tax=Parastrongyloides trichosuri TaxID=131310 RepID=A0A0N4ZJY2_PARTI
MAAEQPCYALVNVPNDYDLPSEGKLKQLLEKGDNKTKIDALKKLIFLIQNGEKVGNGMIMHVIRFCLLTDDHYLKKLLLIFWEVVPKTNSEGKLLQEMILVCDAYRKDLQHPNEFVRGSTLRFLCKLKQPELLEPLMPSIRQCLEHRHSYVRRNAVLAIFIIYKNFDFLIPDAPEVIANFLETEQDSSCKRNAFMMLLHVDQQKALDFLADCIEQVNSFNDILQLIIVELIYKVCHNNPAERSRYIRCVYNLLQSSSPAVRYEAAGTLITLSTAPGAIKAAASVYIELIIKESDNNVKIIVLDKLIQLRESLTDDRVIQEMVMDILRVLSAPDNEVRSKTLYLALDLASSRNVHEMVMFLKKEIDKTTNDTQDETQKYRQLLVRTLHSATIKFPDVATQIIPVLMAFLSDITEGAAADVLVFIREAVQRLPELRQSIINHLLEVFGDITNASVYRSALWILGEYCQTSESLVHLLKLVKKSLGDLPIVNEDEDETETKEESTEKKKTQNHTLISADGTYAAQSALINTSTPTEQDNKPVLRRALIEGDFFLAASLANTMTKVVLRFAQENESQPERVNRVAGEVLFIFACIIHAGKSKIVKQNITEDDLDRLSASIKIINDRWPDAFKIYLGCCRESLELMLEAKGDVDRHEEVKLPKNKKANEVDVDKTIIFTQLNAGSADGDAGTNLIDLSLSQALGTAPKNTKFNLASSKLGKVIQLAGFSDPVYAEAIVNVNQYVIVLDVLVVNRTSDTLQNLTLELSTVGDLKLVDKPTPLNLGPHDFTNIKATVKVTSTENGVIFSTLSYDIRSSTSDRNCIYLQDIHIDIMDYIEPGNLTDTEFRKKWAEFEWENKVAVQTPITDLRDYLTHLATSTNMKCLTTDGALAGECNFLAANFCCHSIFGEDALANVSIEKTDVNIPNSPIIGQIKIRAKSQGMALSMGDKMNAAQKCKAVSEVI